jgi:UDP-N-acetyl-D-glucosamine dehydrogenase
MPYFCVEKLTRSLNDHSKPVRGSRIAILGVSYKAGVGDLRESPALRLIELLHGMGAELSYHDPHVPELEHHGIRLACADLDDGALAEADIVCVVTSHSTVDYGRVAERAPLVIDFRNVVPRGRDNVVRL